jgi:hypothetical protein
MLVFKARSLLYGVRWDGQDIGEQFEAEKRLSTWVFNSASCGF